jgi:hypothetical protein
MPSTKHNAFTDMLPGLLLLPNSPFCAWVVVHAEHVRKAVQGFHPSCLCPDLAGLTELWATVSACLIAVQLGSRDSCKCVVGIQQVDQQTAGARCKEVHQKHGSGSRVPRCMVQSS